MPIRIRGHRLDGEEIAGALCYVAAAVFLVGVTVCIALVGVLAATSLLKAILTVAATIP